MKDTTPASVGGIERGEHSTTSLDGDPDLGWSWYCVPATYKSVGSTVPRKRHLWQRMYLLFRAPSNRRPDAVRAKAEEIARGKQHDNWALQQVEVDEIRELFDNQIEEGTEVYWEFFERVDKVES